MKNLTICWTLLTIYGCTQPILNSSSSVISSPSPGCSDQPAVSLRGEDVEEIALNEQTLTKSGQATANKSVGYKFDAESGQKLSYATDADICIWVYTPDNQIINTLELPKDGTYIIQVSAPQGLRTFDLNMSLTSLQASSTPTPVPVQASVATITNTPSVTPSPSSVPRPRRTPSYTPPPSVPVSGAEPVHDISQEEALEIVQNWYTAKPRIFGTAYDISLVEQLTTGQLYADLSSYDGPIAWLKDNDFYYTYDTSEILNIIEFSNLDQKPYIKVRVFEELYLHGSNGIDRQKSGPYEGNFIYFFEKENETWKIYAYKKLT
ncbi:hypothetical protein A2T98_01425 [Nodularia spumigena CENA596]|uniref:Plastid division protein CDP1-like IMS domain-containing protein n=1 Tax=Nodularia spumigena CENA596 TaxID=1819295 RepID=A0A166KU64_NODSP|nr:ARC6/PARC6 family protein [Nodularia spumigena]KZL51549.1 hypothetical protein A2T98_01425 [Nodularia spumigena CENA596]